MEVLHRSTRLSSRARLAAVLALSVGLAGCATVRTVPPGPSLPAPAAWNQAGGDLGQAATGDLSSWWQRLNDATLTSLIEQALKANTDLRTAQARLRQARANRDLADANRYPSLSASGSARDHQNDSRNTGSFGASLDASWELDVFGAKRLALQASQADLEATIADLNGVRVSLAAEVASGYVSVRSYQARLDVARRNAATQAETLQLTDPPLPPTTQTWLTSAWRVRHPPRARPTA